MPPHSTPRRLREAHLRGPRARHRDNVGEGVVLRKIHRHVLDRHRLHGLKTHATDGASRGAGFQPVLATWGNPCPCSFPGLGRTLSPPMNWIVLIGLVAVCGVLMLLERRGLRTTLALVMKGDVKRETRWLAQYGQSVCTGVAALLVFQLDPLPQHGKRAIVLIAAVVGG